MFCRGFFSAVIFAHWSALWSVPLHFFVGLQHPQVCNFANTKLKNYLTTCWLLLSLSKFIFSFMICHTRTLGGHESIRRLAKRTWRSPVLHLFAILAHFIHFCKLVQVLLLNANTKKSRVLNYILTQIKPLNTLNVSK